MDAIMKQGHFSWDRFHTMPVVGIIRHVAPEAMEQLLPRFLAAGLRTLEITLNTAGAASMIAEAQRRYGDALNIGAGTVCSLEELDRALDAGAAFIVSPITDEPLIRACQERQVPVFPGAFTPTEIYRAWTLGADLVKVFPATRLGPEYIRELKAPLPDIKLLPTGGVDRDNGAAYLQAGAEGLAMGSQLFDKRLIREGRWDELEQHFREMVHVVQAAKAPRP